MSRRIAAWLMVLMAAPPATAGAQETTLAAVLQRAAAYVAHFSSDLAGVVAEEHYVQEVKAFSKRPGALLAPTRTELRSDLLLIRPAGGDWVEFRDIFEVNDVPVRDRAERLTRLFLESTPSALEQISRIRTESARYNVGEITRNINTPLFALQILAEANQPRFKFKRSGERVPTAVAHEGSVSAAFRTTAEIWTIEYTERQRDTIIKTAGLKDLPTRGRFWIDPFTGHVLMSELIAKSRAVEATVDVSYQSEPLLGFLVPVEMRERYVDRSGSRVEGTAEYGRFRQFQVNVDEQFLLKK